MTVLTLVPAPASEDIPIDRVAQARPQSLAMLRERLLLSAQNEYDAKHMRKSDEWKRKNFLPRLEYLRGVERGIDKTLHALARLQQQADF
jgi:hypothetical protein